MNGATTSLTRAASRGCFFAAPDDRLQAASQPITALAPTVKMPVSPLLPAMRRQFFAPVTQVREQAPQHALRLALRPRPLQRNPLHQVHHLFCQLADIRQRDGMLHHKSPHAA